jgi:hypothetical protein
MPMLGAPEVQETLVAFETARKGISVSILSNCDAISAKNLLKDLRIIDGERIPVRAGEEYFIPRGVLHNGEVVAGTRTIHAFGGHRAERVQNP